MTRITQLKKKIEFILENHKEARDSDAWLTAKLWAVYYPQNIYKRPKVEGGDPVQMVTLGDIVHVLPREDAVKRIRAKIQNFEGRYLPTSWAVAKKRKIAEEAWREWSVMNK